MSGVYLQPADGALADAVAGEGWLDDEATNQAMGYGSGDDGRERAYMDFRDMMEGEELFGAWLESKPIGYVWMSVVGDPRRLARFVAFLSPALRGTLGARVGLRLLGRVAQHSLGGDAERLETEVLQRNKRATRLLKFAGFRPEGLRSHGYWMDGKPEVTVVYRLLGREWQNGAAKRLLGARNAH